MERGEIAGPMCASVLDSGEHMFVGTKFRLLFDRLGRRGVRVTLLGY